MAYIRMFLVLVVLVSLAIGINGTSHLMFSNSTEAVNATRSVCGQSELCLSQTDTCDPEAAGDCLFVSIMAGPPAEPNGSELKITLRGSADKDTFIAFGLGSSSDMGNTMFFICSGNEAGMSFFTRDLNESISNANLTTNERATKEIRRNITEGVVRCRFTIPNVNSSTQASSTQQRTTGFAITIANGSLANGVPGSIDFRRTTMNVNISNPNALQTTTPMPATTSSSPPSFGSPVYLLLCVVLASLPLLRM